MGQADAVEQHLDLDGIALRPDERFVHAHRDDGVAGGLGRLEEQQEARSPSVQVPV